MNIGRLVSFIDFVGEQEQRYSVQEKLSALDSALNEFVSSPQNPELQSRVSSNLTEFQAAVFKLRAAYTQARLDMLRDISGGEVLGPEIGNWVARWISSNAMTPVVARDFLSDLKARREKKLTELRETKTYLNNLGLQPETPPIGQAELAFLIPRPLFENDFDRFIRELGQVRQIIRSTSEATTGSVESISIGEISSSDPLLFLGVSPATILVLAATVKWLLDALKSSLEIRDLYSRGKEIGLPPKVLKGMEDAVTERLYESIDKRVIQILQNFRGDEQRKNELSNALTMDTRQLLARLERGMKVEIRVGAIENADNSAQPVGDLARQLAQLDALSKELIFPKLEGEPLVQLTGPQTEALDEGQPEEAKVHPPDDDAAVWPLKPT
jgi:hypothetical protein